MAEDGVMPIQGRQWYIEPFGEIANKAISALVQEHEIRDNEMTDLGPREKLFPCAYSDMCHVATTPGSVYFVFSQLDGGDILVNPQLSHPPAGFVYPTSVRKTA
jgi:hypothetical protein